MKKTMTQRLNAKNAAAIAKTKAGAKRSAELQIEVRDGKKTAGQALKEMAPLPGGVVRVERKDVKTDRPFDPRKETLAQYLCRHTGCKACLAETERAGSFVNCPAHCPGCHKDREGRVAGYCSGHRHHTKETSSGPVCLCGVLKANRPGRTDPEVKANCPVHRPTDDQIVNGVPPERMVQPPRDHKGLNRVQAPCGECPVRLTEAKWSSIVEWAEKVRDWCESRGFFLTAQGCLYWLGQQTHLGHTEEGVSRVLRAKRRFALLYADELAADDSRHDAIIRGAVAASSRPTPEAAVRAPHAGAVAGSGVVPTHSSGMKTTAKRPGVVRKIHELLKAASKKAPATRAGMLVELVKAFPEREEAKMKNTLGGYIPSGVKAERGVVLEADGKGGFWVKDADKEKLP
jgi:hypothetical protein